MVNKFFSYGKDYLPISFNQTELDDINLLIRDSPTFFENIIKKKKDYTQEIIREALNTFYSPIPRAFIGVIRGRIGRKTGIFKTAFMLQLAGLLDDNFSVFERVAFTADNLRLLIKNNMKRKQIYCLDEQNRDLKTGSYVRLKNLMEGCREEELSFLCAGVPEQIPTGFADFYFERLGESHDKYLPDKTLYFMMRNDLNFRPFYRGIFKWNLVPLTNKRWNEIWKDYSELKTEHQKVLRNASSTSINYKKLAEDLFKDILKEKYSLKHQDIKRKVFFAYADYTKDDKKFIIEELMKFIYIHLDKNKLGD